MGKFDDAKKMAERKAAEKQAGKKGEKAKGNRLLNFFRELRAELKRIVWPDKKKLKQSTAIVVAIVLAAAVLIFAVDTLVNTSLTAAGFYDTRPRVTTTTTLEESSVSEESAAETSAVETTAAATEATTAG